MEFPRNPYGIPKFRRNPFFIHGSMIQWGTPFPMSAKLDLRRCYAFKGKTKEVHSFGGCQGLLHGLAPVPSLGCKLNSPLFGI